MKKNIYACVVTGEEKYLPPSIIKSKMSKYKDEDEFRQYYICPVAAKLLRAGSTVSEIREKLNIKGLPEVKPIILTRLNLMRKKKGLRVKESTERLERQKYLNSQEFKDKMRAAEERKQNMTFQEWVEESTGGKDRIWLKEGACTGTCIRPDIFVSMNNKACDGCPYHQYCLCRNKRLSHEKKHRR